MNNTMKLLRAFIEASGYEIKTIKPVPVSEWSPGVIYDMNTTYKVTKKLSPSELIGWCDLTKEEKVSTLKAEIEALNDD